MSDWSRLNYTHVTVACTCVHVFRRSRGLYLYDPLNLGGLTPNWGLYEFFHKIPRHSAKYLKFYAIFFSKNGGHECGGEGVE